jgi:hypothetical protein
MMSEFILETAAREFADATSKPPFLHELGVEGARKVLDDIQVAPIDKPDVDEKWIVVPAAVGEDEGPYRQASRGSGDPSGDRLHARWRLDPRQRRHA